MTLERREFLSITGNSKVVSRYIFGLVYSDRANSSIVHFREIHQLRLVSLTETFCCAEANNLGLQASGNSGRHLNRDDALRTLLRTLFLLGDIERKIH